VEERLKIHSIPLKRFQYDKLMWFFNRYVSRTFFPSHIIYYPSVAASANASSKGALGVFVLNWCLLVIFHSSACETRASLAAADAAAEYDIMTHIHSTGKSEEFEQQHVILPS